MKKGFTVFGYQIRFFYPLLTLICSLFTNNCFPQSKIIDSLQQALKDFDAKKTELHKNHLPGDADTVKVNILNEISRQYWMVADFAPSKKYADEALAIALHSDYKKGIALSYSNIGIIYTRQGNYPAAQNNFSSSLKLREEIGDKIGMAACYGNIANIFYQQGNYPEALKNNFTALKLREETGNKLAIAISYGNIGNIYINQGNNPEAMKNYSSALKLFEETGDKNGIAMCYGNIGNIYNQSGNYPGALKNFMIALKLNQEINNIQAIAVSYSGIGSSYANQGNTAEAIKNYNAALQIQEKIGDKDGILNSCMKIGPAKTKMNLAGEGRMWILRGLQIARETESISSLRDGYHSLAEADSALGNFESAYENYKLYLVYRDSMNNEEANRKSMQAKMQYDYDKKEAETKALTDAELKKQKLVRNGFVILSILIVIAVIFFIDRLQRKRKKQLETVRSRISRDLHDDMGSTLQSISVMSEIARMKSTSDNKQESIPFIEKIGSASREMVEKMNDIVWAVNPQNDHFENIIFHMRAFGGELLAGKDIALHFKADHDLNNVKLSMEDRKSFFLVYKEALNNAYKYSGAKNVKVEITKTNHELKLMIEDDGHGFNMNEDRLKTGGNGLKNMKTRAIEMNGSISIQSQPGAGTRVNLAISLS